MAPVAPAEEPSRFPGITHLKKAAFLSAFTETGNVRLAAEQAEITRRTHTNWLHNDPSYAAAFEEAKEDAADRLEQEARRRAHDGLVTYKFTKDGDPILHPITNEPYYEFQYSDTLLIFLLKGLRPERYKDRHEHTGKNGGPIEVTWDLSKLSDQELAQLDRLRTRATES